MEYFHRINFKKTVIFACITLKHTFWGKASYFKLIIILSKQNVIIYYFNKIFLRLLAHSKIYRATRIFVFSFELGLYLIPFGHQGITNFAFIKFYIMYM